MQGILWGLWSEQGGWDGDGDEGSGPNTFPTLADAMKYDGCGGRHPRPLAVPIDAYRALRDALAAAIEHHPWCAHGGTVAHTKFKPECPQCKAELAALAVTDMLLAEANPSTDEANR